MAFAAALFAASCGQDELPGGGNADEPAQTRTYTFTVSPDLTMDGDAAARSEGTAAEMPTRCFMQVFDSEFNKVNEKYENKITDGSCTFQVQLAIGKEYHIAFYADNSNAPVQNDLTNIQYDPSSGEVVAYGELLIGKPENMKWEVTLEHIVTKITLKHEGNPFTVAANEDFKITFPCAKEYNMLDDKPQLGGYKEFTYTFSEGKTINDDEEVCTFYTIVPIDVDVWPDITLNLHQLTRTISGIEWEINSHVTLQGDLSEDNPNWGATSEYAQKQIEHFFLKEDGSSKGTPGVDGNYFYLPESDIDKFESVIGAILHEEVEISLDKNFTILEKEFEDNYTFKIINDVISKKLTIHITGSILYNIRYDPYAYTFGYENFSTVSNVLEQSTE